MSFFDRAPSSSQQKKNTGTSEGDKACCCIGRNSQSFNHCGNSQNRKSFERETIPKQITKPSNSSQQRREEKTEISTHSVIVFASICFFMVRNFILLVKFHFHSLLSSPHLPSLTQCAPLDGFSP